MRQGTPGFVGERLREAREARGISATDLAAQLGVSKQVISQYENGGVSPHPEVMRRLATTLELPVNYFCRPPHPEMTRPLYFRSLARTTKTARQRSRRRFTWLLDVADWVRRFVDFPEINIPDVSVPRDPGVITDDFIERVAEHCREFWGLGQEPISNVVRLLERNGVVVARGAASFDIDAFSTWVDDAPYVFLGAEKTSAVRVRFSALHELGHLILHRQVDEERANTLEIHKLMESQADRFASAMLLPSESLARDLRGSAMVYFRALKPKWLASIGTMIYRAKDLGLITSDQAQSLWKYRAKLGWNTREPWDDELPIEEPILLRKSVELILAEDVVAREDITSEIALSAPDVEELAGLRPGFLSDDRVIPIALRNRTSSDHVSSEVRHLTRVK